MFSNSSSKAKEYVIYSLECCHIFHSSSQLWNVIYLLHVFFLLITSSQYSSVDRKLPISGPKLVCVAKVYEQNLLIDFVDLGG